MKDISKLKNYREKYKRFYNINFDNTYSIHHIDCNHSNNNIENLMLIPRKLHNSYHFYKSCLDAQQFSTLISGNFANSQNYYIYCLENFLKVLNECNVWYDFKLFLDGKIPNIHKIDIKEFRNVSF